MSEQPQEQKKRVVGFAILPEKVDWTTSSNINKHVVSQSSEIMQARKHITGDLLKVAAAVNIEILAIDPSKPVAEQGSFDLILQKCRDAG